MRKMRYVAASLAVSALMLPTQASAAPSLPSCAVAKIESDGGYVTFQTDPESGTVAWGAYTWTAAEDFGWWHVEWFQDSIRRGVHAKNYPPHHSYPPKFARPGNVLTVMGWHHSNTDRWYRVGGQCRVS
jgi:hypothetical protein